MVEIYYSGASEEAIAMWDKDKIKKIVQKFNFDKKTHIMITEGPNSEPMFNLDLFGERLIIVIDSQGELVE